MHGIWLSSFTSCTLILIFLSSVLSSWFFLMMEIWKLCGSRRCSPIIGLLPGLHDSLESHSVSSIAHSVITISTSFHCLYFLYKESTRSCLLPCHIFTALDHRWVYQIKDWCFPPFTIVWILPSYRIEINVYYFIKMSCRGPVLNRTFSC